MTPPALTFPHLPPDDPANTPCNRCGELHLTSSGQPSCTAHAKTAGKGPCGAYRMHGQRVCKKHGGLSGQAQAGARRRIALEQAKAELDALGGALDVDPAEALLAMVRKAAWNVCYLETLLQPEGDGDAPSLVTWSEQGGKPHPHVQLYNEERDRLARFSKLALDAGVSERLVRLAEDQGRVVIQLVEAAFQELGLTEEQRQRVPVVMGRLIELQAKQV